MQIERLDRRCLLAATGWTVDISDPFNVGTSITNEITRLVPYCGNLWADRISGTGANLLVRVVLDKLVSTASGDSPVNAFVKTTNGVNLFEQGATNKLRTGVDDSPEPDIEIHINPDYAKTLWFDPSPETRGLSSAQPVPGDKVDAVTVLAHEFGHAFIFNGLRDFTTFKLLKPAEQSAFDSLVSIDSSGHPVFTGTAAKAAFGGKAVSLMYGQSGGDAGGTLYHLGAPPSAPGSELNTGLMNAVAFQTGQRYFVDALLMAVQADTLAAATPDPISPDKIPTTVTFTGTKTYVNAFNQKVTLKLAGPGKATLIFPDTIGGNAGTAGNPANPVRLSLTGTNSKTTTFTLTPNATVNIGTVSATGGLRSFTATTMNAAAITLGGLGSLSLGNVTGSRLTIGSAAGKLTFTAKNLVDTTLSLPDVASMTVGSWLTTDTNIAPSTINSATSIKATSMSSGTLTIKKDVGTISVTQSLTSQAILVGKSLGALTTSRNLIGSTISATNILSVTVKGSISTSRIEATSQIRKVSAGSMSNSRIAVSVIPAPSTKLPTTATVAQLFRNKKASLIGLTVKGSFVANQILAPQISNVSLGTVTSANGGSTSGILGDVLTNITGKTAKKGVFSVGSSAKGTAFTDRDFSVVAL